jgi:DNA repair ATPase RecN
LNSIERAISDTQTAERVEARKAIDEMIIGEKPEGFFGQLVESFDRADSLSSVSSAQDSINRADSQIRSLRTELTQLRQRIDQIQSLRRSGGGYSVTSAGLSTDGLSEVDATGLFATELVNFTLDLTGFNSLASDLALDAFEYLQLSRSESQLRDVLGKVQSVYSNLRNLNQGMKRELDQLSENQRRMAQEFVENSLQRLVAFARSKAG